MTAPPVSSPGQGLGVVTSAHPAATDAGLAALAAGGNAIDAAVATAWALCVCEPSGSGLGGQTVMLVHHADSRVVVIDGHSRAPSGVSKDSVSRAQQRTGYRAATTPTTPRTLAYAQTRYGRLRLADGLAAAIALAADGYEVSPLQARQQRWCEQLLAATPAASRFLRDGRAYLPGEIFRQPELARCLQRLAIHGVEDFYEGAVARSIVEDMEREGGLIRASDLLAVGRPQEGPPRIGRYRGRTVLTAPAPAGGPQLVRVLERLEAGDSEPWRSSRESWHRALAVAVRDAFVERERDHSTRQGAPGREAASPAGELALTAGASERAGETTHLCTADAEGNVVTLTQSVQSLFGAKVANPDFGFLYNNYLTTCPRRETHRFHLAPGGPARSNAAPTLVMAGQPGEGRLALGAAGSRRIISSVAHVISGVIDLGLDLEAALGAPRVHPRLSGRVWLERPAATPTLKAWLETRFGEVQVRPRHSYTMGAVQALRVGSDSVCEAAADPRRDGKAVAR